MVKCRSCNSEYAEESNFCPICGFRTEKGETENVRTPVDRRPNWEKDVEEGLQNAQKIMEEALEVTKASIREMRQELREEIGKAKEKTSKRVPVYCPDCGNKNPSDSEYCVKCGKHITSQS